jgi:hypothetical protein
MTVPCSSGVARARIPPIANPYKIAVRLTYAVRANGSRHRSDTLRLTVREAAARSQPKLAPAPPSAPTPAAAAPAVTLSISPQNIPSTGGTAVVSFSAQRATFCTLASTPALWNSANPAPVNCNGTYTVTLPPTVAAQQWTFVFKATSSTGLSSTQTEILSELAPPTPTATWRRSPNWSGYVVPSAALVTEASGAWTVPTLNCSDTPNGGAAIWVGIGGYGWPEGGSSGVLLQTGVTTDCVDGVAQYHGWFEEYPSDPNAAEDFDGFPVSAGDSIEASVFRGSGGAWETKVDDLTTGLSGIMVTGEGWGVAADGASSFSKQGSTAGLRYGGGYTAEWIVEDYSNADEGAMVPLADFGSVTFTDLRTSLPSWALSPSEGEAIAQGGAVLSTPSAPSGEGFSVSYTG